MLNAPVARQVLMRTGLSLVVLLLLSGCDPGFSYRPQGWQAAEESDYEWFASFGGVKLTTWGLGGLIGARYLSPEFEFHNSTDQPLVLESVDLVAEAGRHSGELPDGGTIEWRTVEPGSTKRIPIGWDFEERPMDLLGPHPSLILTFRLGDEPHQVEITYERME